MCDEIFLYVRFEVLMAASMDMTVFWDVTSCSVTEIYRRFRAAYCLHHHGERPRGEGSMHIFSVTTHLDYTTVCVKRGGSKSLHNS
jgi:hypothetical protein